MRLIDADKLIRTVRFLTLRDGKEIEIHYVEAERIDSAPTIDAIPIEWIEKQIKCLREIADIAFEENGGFIEREHYALHAVERLLKDWHERKEE